MVLNIDKILKTYIPMTETAYYILLSLSIPRHGYGIIKYVEQLTKGRIKLGSGTVYGTLMKMQKDKIIQILSDECRKVIYQITPYGKVLIKTEIERVKKLYDDTISQGDFFNA